MDALEKSIVKWEGKLSIVQNNLEEPFKGFQYLFGIDECPLCELYFEKDCNGCPIYQKTNFQHCVGTPYDDIYDSFICNRNDPKLDKNLVSIIKKEIRFLKSLLPNRTKQKSVEK